MEVPSGDEGSMEIVPPKPPTQRISDSGIADDGGEEQQFEETNGSHPADGFGGYDSEEDDDGPKSSFENIVNQDKLNNGIEQAKDLFAWGWGSLKKGVEDVSNSDTVKSMREAAAPVVEKSLDACARAGKKVSEAAEDAAPTIQQFKAKAIDATSKGADAVKESTIRAYDIAKEQSIKGVEELKRRATGKGFGEGDEGASSAGGGIYSEYSSENLGGGKGKDDDDGPGAGNFTV